MSSNDPRWRPRGRCDDCKHTYPLDEAITHRCDEAEARVRAASAAGRFFLIAVIVSLAAVGLVAYVAIKVGLWLATE